MTKAGHYDPWEHAERLGIHVVYGRLRTANGLWLPEHRTIVLKPRMRPSSSAPCSRTSSATSASATATTGPSTNCRSPTAHREAETAKAHRG